MEREEEEKLQPFFSLPCFENSCCYLTKKKLSFNSKILIKTHQNHRGLIFQSNIKTTGKKKRNYSVSTFELKIRIKMGVSDFLFVVLLWDNDMFPIILFLFWLFESLWVPYSHFQLTRKYSYMETTQNSCPSHLIPWLDASKSVWCKSLSSIV